MKQRLERAARANSRHRTQSAAARWWSAAYRGSLLAALAVLLLQPVALHAEPPLRIYTVNYPLMYLAGRIAGDHGVVSFPAPADVDPAFWHPDADTVGAYQKADIILLNGAGYARWVSRATLPQLRLVNTSAAFRNQYIKGSKTVTHRHGPGGDHAHTGTAFTTWLDFEQAAQQAQAIAAALGHRRPALREAFDRNHEALAADLHQLDAQMKALAARNGGRPLVASHPVYQYLARRYELNLESVLWEPDSAPSEHQWAALAALLERHPARLMLWEQAPDPEIARRLEAMGVTSVVFSPCGNVPAQGDFLTVMRHNVKNLDAVLRQNSAQDPPNPKR